MKKWLCLACGNIIEIVETAFGCPICGCTGVPADMADAVTVTLTVHELRVLTMWAEFYASAGNDEEHRMMRKAVYGIAHRLTQQSERLATVGITFANELADLRVAHGAVEQNVIREDHNA